MIGTCLNLFGLLLTGLGAFVTARSVIISKDQAKMLSGTHWNGNEALRRALLAQSHNAQIGLYFICVGTSSQIAALLYSQIAALIYPLFDAVDNWGLTPPCRYKKRTPSVHSRGLQLALFDALCPGDFGGAGGTGVSRRKGLLAQATLPTRQRLSVTASTFWSIASRCRKSTIR